MNVIRTCCAEGKVNASLSQKLTSLQLKLVYVIRFNPVVDGSICMSMIELSKGSMFKKQRMECILPMLVFELSFLRVNITIEIRLVARPTPITLMLM